jgi:transposase
VFSARGKEDAVEQLHDRVAGLDVHRDSVVVCVRLSGPRRGVVWEKQGFATTTGALRRLCSWLADQAVQLVAMEATGVYWKPVYYALEDDFQVWLCNPHHVKNVPGRKTDLSDAQWLADVAAHGMIRPSFVPPPPIRQLRDLTRYRKTQIDARVAEIQRLDKLLQDAGIKLSSVASKLLTQSGRAMIEALIAGQRDPAALAALAKGRMRPKIPQLTEALDGHFGAHHCIAATQVLAHIDCLDTSIAVLTEQIETRMRPYAAARILLDPIPGFDQRVIDTVIAETGADMSRFPTAANLAAWAGLSPGNHESAGKRRRVGVVPGNRWLRRTLIEAARAAARTKGSYFAAQYHRIAHRRGPNKAAIAVAHSLSDLTWHMLTTGECYTDLGADYFQRRRDPEREANRLIRQLQALGYQVNPTDAPTPAA